MYGRQNYSFIGDYLPGNFAYDSETLLSNQMDLANNALLLICIPLRDAIDFVGTPALSAFALFFATRSNSPQLSRHVFFLFLPFLLTYERQSSVCIVQLDASSKQH